MQVFSFILLIRDLKLFLLQMVLKYKKGIYLNVILSTKKFTMWILLSTKNLLVKVPTI